MKISEPYKPSHRLATGKVWRGIMMLCMSVACLSAMADDYYYFRGERVPLILDPTRVSLCMPTRCAQDLPVSLEGARRARQICDTAVTMSIFEASSPDTSTSLSTITSGSFLREAIKHSASCESLLAPCYLTTDSQPLAISPYVHVRLRDTADVHVLIDKAAGIGLEYLGEADFLPLWHRLRVRSRSNLTSLQAANALYETGLFEAASPDFVWENILQYTWDENVNCQWALHNAQYPGIDINVSEAWNYATGWSVKIAIFDIGVDVNHPDLRDNIDTLSYNAMNNTSPAQYFPSGSHGTHCAGIAAGVRNNGIGIAGVAPDARIVPISLNELCASPENTQTLEEDLMIARGFRWARLNNIDVISNSWDPPCNLPAACEAIDSALTYGRHGRGCVVVFAAGNYQAPQTSQISSFISFDQRLLVVGAVDSAGCRTAFSRQGLALDVMAPGKSIYSTYNNHAYGMMDGTSMACPHVAGLAAVILEINPRLTNIEVNSIIESTAKKIGPLSYGQNPYRPNGGWNAHYGYGLIDACRAVQAAFSTE